MFNFHCREIIVSHSLLLKPRNVPLLNYTAIIIYHTKFNNLHNENTTKIIILYKYKNREKDVVQKLWNQNGILKSEENYDNGILDRI